MQRPLTSEQGYRTGSQFFHVHDGYYYYSDRRRNGVTYFRCIYTADGCSGRAILRAESFLEQSSPHNHEPNFLYAQLRRERQALVNQAGSLDYVRPHDILNAERNANLMFGHAFSEHSLGPAMDRAHRRMLPDPPKTLDGLVTILQNERYASLSVTLDGSNESIYCGACKPNDACTAIVFMSKRCSGFLKLATCVFAVSMPFKMHGTDHQFYVHILGTVWDGCVILLAWMILDSNSVDSYMAGLALLRSKIVGWQFRTVICDVHGAIAEAYHNVFGANIKFSLGDFINGLAEKAISILESDELQENSPWRKIINLMCVLPMVPGDLTYLSLHVVRNQGAPTQNDTMGVLLNHIQAQLLYLERGSEFCLSGDIERTVDASHTACDKMKSAFGDNARHARDFYTVLKHLVRTEEISFGLISAAQRGQIQPAKRSFCLANDQEIVMLTQNLIRPTIMIESAVKNLLTIASEKINDQIFGALQLQN